MSALRVEPQLPNPYGCLGTIFETPRARVRVCVCVCARVCACVCVHTCISHSVMSDSSWHHGLEPTRLLCPWDSPGKNTGMGCHFPLQGIFPTQGLNLGLWHCRQTLYRLSHQQMTFLSTSTAADTGDIWEGAISYLYDHIQMWCAQTSYGLKLEFCPRGKQRTRDM